MVDIFYVDYCNCCKDLDIMDTREVPCHHPWYCWCDNREVQELEYRLGVLKEKEYWNGRLTAFEKKLYYELKNRKFELVKTKLREFRRLKT